MSTVQIELSSEELLAAVKQLPAEELNKFERQFVVWQQNRAKAESRKNGRRTTETEAALLARIAENSRLPAAEQRRFNRLRRKQQVEELSAPEQAELQQLWRQVEQMTVTRLEALTALAQRRGTDVRTLMRELGLRVNRDVF